MYLSKFEIVSDLELSTAKQAIAQFFRESDVLFEEMPKELQVTDWKVFRSFGLDIDKAIANQWQSAGEIFVQFEKKENKQTRIVVKTANLQSLIISFLMILMVGMFYYISKEIILLKMFSVVFVLGKFYEHYYIPVIHFRSVLKKVLAKKSQNKCLQGTP